MNNTYYEFRAPKSIDELREILKLRYRVYKDCRLVDFVENNQSSYDIDQYDERAFQMGLFVHTDEGTKIVGSHREIIDGIGPHYDWFKSIEEELNMNLHNEFDYREYPFPALTYDSTANSVLKRFYSNVKEQRKTVGEASRYAIDSSIRSLSLARFLVEAIIATFIIDKSINYGIMWVHANHVTFTIVPNDTC